MLRTNIYVCLDASKLMLQNDFGAINQAQRKALNEWCVDGEI